MNFITGLIESHLRLLKYLNVGSQRAGHVTIYAEKWQLNIELFCLTFQKMELIQIDASDSFSQIKI